MFPDENAKHMVATVTTTDALELINIQYINNNSCSFCLGLDTDKNNNDTGENIYGTVKITKLN
jgi:hypothetical protein